MIFKEFDLITPFLYPYFRVFQTKGTKEWEISFYRNYKSPADDVTNDMAYPTKIWSAALNVD